MKKTLTKALSVFVAFSCLILALPLSVFAASEMVSGPFVFTSGGGGYIITDYTDRSATEVTIPEKLTSEQGITRNVVGVRDYAFGFCENLTTVYVPSTLTLDSLEPQAFLTSSSIMKFIKGKDQLGETASIDDMVLYIAKQMYGDPTEWEIEYIDRIYKEKLDLVDLSGADTDKAKIMTIIKNLDKLELQSGENGGLTRFDMWLKFVKFDNMTLKGENGIDAQTYAKNLSIRGLKYEVTNTYNYDEDGTKIFYQPKDTNNDNVYDAATITGYSGDIQKIKVPDKLEGLVVDNISADAFSEARNLNSIEIPETITTMGNKAVGFFSDGTPIPGFTIYGYAKSRADKYATANGFKFVNMSDLPSLSATEISMKKEQMLGISINNYKGDVKWISDDTTIASVTQDTALSTKAYITGVEGGEATIYAFIDGYTLECKVTVQGEFVVSSITKTTTTADPGDPAQIITSKRTGVTVTETGEGIVTFTKKPGTGTETGEPPVSITTKTSVSGGGDEPGSKSSVSSTTVSAVNTPEGETGGSSSITTVSGSSSVTTEPDGSDTQPGGTTSISIHVITKIITEPPTSETSVSRTTQILIVTETDIITEPSITTTTAATTTNKPLRTSISLITSDDIVIGTAIIILPDDIPDISVTSTTVSTTMATTTSTTATTTTSVVTTLSETTTTLATTTLKIETEPDVVVVTTAVYIGDANEDGKVNVVDAAYIANLLARGKGSWLPYFADFNRDGRVNVVDAAAIARALASNKNMQWERIYIIVRQKSDSQKVNDFSADRLDRIKSLLGVPATLGVTYKQGNPFYLKDKGIWVRDIEIYYKSNLIASGTFAMEDESLIIDTHKYGSFYVV